MLGSTTMCGLARRGASMTSAWSTIKTTLHTKPANGSTHWSVRGVAAETGISKTSVQRYFQLFCLQPHFIPTYSS